MKQTAKRLLCLLVLACTAAVLTLSAAADGCIVGDVNSDGAVDDGDVVLLTKYLNGWPDCEVDQDAADTDRDGEVNNRDLIILTRYLDGWPGYDEHIGKTPEPEELTVTGQVGDMSMPYDSETGIYLWVDVSGGTYPYSYEWRSVRRGKNGRLTSHAIEGAEDYVYRTLEAGTFYCRITDADGNWVDSERIHITYSLSVVTQPVGGVLSGGGAVVELSTHWTGAVDPVSFQWYRNDIAIEGAGETGSDENSSTYKAYEAGLYYCQITDSEKNTIRTDAVSVTDEREPPHITKQPADGTIVNGYYRSSVEVAAGNEPYHYFWYKDGEYVGYSSENHMDLTSPGVYYVEILGGNSKETVSDSFTVSPEFSISLQPKNSYKGETLTVGVSGGKAPYVYEWYLVVSGNPGKVSGASSFSYTPASLANYYCRITDSNGESLQSETVKILRPLNITKQPSGCTLPANSDAVEISFTAVGEAPLSYFLYEDGEFVRKTEESCFYISTPGTYYIMVVDGYGGKKNTDTFTVSSPELKITSQPSGCTMPANFYAVEISLTASGRWPLTYLLYRDGNFVQKSEESSFLISTPGSYYITVVDGLGRKTNSDAFTVSPRLEITSQPQPVYLGAALSVAVSGGLQPYSYTWYDKNGAISGANTSSYTPKSEGFYKCVVTDKNGASAESDNAAAYGEFKITGQPEDICLKKTETGTLTVKTEGLLDSATYLWQKWNESGSKWEYFYSSESANSIYIAGTQPGIYRCVVTAVRMGSETVLISGSAAVTECRLSITDVEVTYEQNRKTWKFKFEVSYGRALNPLPKYEIFIYHNYDGDWYDDTTTFSHYSTVKGGVYWQGSISSRDVKYVIIARDSEGAVIKYHNCTESEFPDKLKP